MDGDGSIPTVIKFRQIMIPIIDAAYFLMVFNSASETMQQHQATTITGTLIMCD